jgi:hypothetical protein
MSAHTSIQRTVALALLAMATASSHADQPIMNMMPRWDGGYGFQLLADTTHRSDLKQGDRTIADGFTEDISQLHLQGVYTWDRSLRLTFKLPYVLDARREVLSESGAKVVQRDRGVGDLTLALPLKHYFNLDARTGNWTLAPQLRIPLGSKSDDYEVANRVWGGGLWAGYETETYRWYFATGAGIWTFEAPEPSEWSYNIDLGWNVRDHMQLLWESDFKWDDEQAFTLSAGPALYWRWNDVVHSRIEWKHDFISEVSEDQPDHGNGDYFSIGVGFVF